ncbi:MAG: T9SS type B sorting domain-containing protein [Bacteroidota bacterium]
MRALLLLMLCSCAARVWAQAPNIRYVTPQAYTVNTGITSLTPTNNGGPMASRVYGQVSTFAGGRASVSYDSQGTDAGFNHPSGIVTDAASNIYVSDYGSGAIRKITPTAVVTTITNINSPSGIAADTQGNLFVTSFDGNKIYKISPGGLVSVFAGNGNAGFNDGPGITAQFSGPGGITADASGNLYVADQVNNKVRKITSLGVVSTLAGSGSAGANDGSGPIATFNNPDGLAIDNQGNIYVADTKNNIIRKITPTGAVSTFAGSSTAGRADGIGTAAGFNYPTGITIDVSGNLYVADYKNYLIRKITPTGIVTTIAGNITAASNDGVGTAASFNAPINLVFDIAGNLYVADFISNIIRKVTLTSYAIDKPLPAGLTFDTATGTISGTPTATSPLTDYTVTAYNVSGSSSFTLKIKVDDISTPVTPPIAPPIIAYPSPTYTFYPGYKIKNLPLGNSGGAVPAIEYGRVTTIPINYPNFHARKGITLDAAGNIYTTDEVDNVIYKITQAGGLSIFAGIAGNANTADGTGTSATFSHPAFLTTDASGDMYETEGNIVRKITPQAVVTTIAGSGGAGKQDGLGTAAILYTTLGLDKNRLTGDLYVVDAGNNGARKITPAGLVSTFAPPGFAGPTGLAIDAAGNVFVAETANRRIKKATPAGTISIFAGSGARGNTDGQGTAASFSDNIGGIAIDQLDNIYVADAGNNLIRKITSPGLVSTLAGNAKGSADGIGAAASFDNPYGITSDRAGFVYITDQNHNLIRKISVYGYTIDKPLPEGLNFDGTTGLISGIPKAGITVPATVYTITGYNGGGVGTTQLTIRVDALPASFIPPPSISYTPQRKTFYLNMPIAAPYYAPANAGGPVPATIYSDVTTITDVANPPAGVFNTPVSVAVDINNNIYVADNGASQVKKIVRNSTITPNTYTITTLSAVFTHPTAVATDAAGNVYVADQNGAMIRRIDPDGTTINTYAGTSTAGYQDGPAVSAQFNQISGMATDMTGNLYIADMGNGMIRKVTQAGNVSTLLTGLNKPTNLTLDASANIYFTEYGTHKIRFLNVTTFKITDYTGTGSPGNTDGQKAYASFNGPYGLAYDPTGNIYISDEKNYSVRRSDINDGTVVIMAGNNTDGTEDGVYTAARFTKPGTIVFDHLGNLILTDGSRIRNIKATGYTISGGSGKLPVGLDFDPKTGIFSGKPSQLWSPTDYMITAYNEGGSSNAYPINIEVVPLVFNFPPLPPKTVCDIGGPDIDPGATTVLGTITYSSDNLAVATIVNGKIHLVGVGQATITAANGIDQPLSQKLTVAKPNITVTITQTNNNTCEDTKTDFTAGYSIDVPNVVATYTYAWQVNGVDMPINSATFSSTTLKNRDKVTCTISACFGSGSKDLIASLTPIRSFTSIIRASVTGGVCPGTPLTYTVLPLNSVQQSGYQWQVNGKNVGSNNPEFTSTALKNGDQITCIVSSISACLSNTTATSNALTVEILPDGDCVIKVPNAFTPNGDGYNDTWNFNLPAAVNFKVTSVKVYSRGGTLVYQSAGYDKPWDGTMNGKRLPVSTYYYIIDSEDRKRVTGNVTIIR